MRVHCVLLSQTGIRSGQKVALFFRPFVVDECYRDFSSTRELKCVTIFDCAQLATATVIHNEYSAMPVNNSRD